jgi:(1->4)-alpha-D-glucan 1-alpha-D-glucosylmutase
MAPLRATYRLQLTAAQGLSSARALIPYLARLGVSHLYLSPLLESRPGSTHGYDVTDPGAISGERGGGARFDELAVAARSAGMGLILDIVPNHMAADPANRYWADPRLRARFFDIDPASGRHRRFFDVDGLAGVRQEDPAVFEATHALVLELVRDGAVDGLRVDHVDGLADPAGYLRELRDAGAEQVWVEKILGAGERLRDWPVCGSTGYDFLGDACALFVDPAAEGSLSGLWRELSGDARGFAEVARAAKLEQARTTFAPEVERLWREHPGLDRAEIERALAALPVYRTYVDPRAGDVDDRDRAAAAGLEPAVRRALLLEDPAPPAFVTRFQQTSPAIMAKGVEDTAFYAFARLLALNEVGCDPGRFGIAAEPFHAANLERCRRFPLAMLSTDTHDSKRSAEVRARIAVLSWMPQAWAERIERWFALSQRFVRDGAPDAVERYLLFQTLAGAWPIEVERVRSYMLKALREAKRNTSWVAPDAAWEAAVEQFCTSLLADAAFLAELEPFCVTVAAAGARAALGQLVLKLTAPGVPDIYQGDELAFRALVDPDNRRPVDWARRQQSLARLGTLPAPGPAGDELRKLWLIRTLLALRARSPEPFAGDYEPLDAGAAGCAYLRGGALLVAVGIRGTLEGSALSAPRGRWRDVLRGGERTFAVAEPLADLLDDGGVAVFERA